MDRLIKCPVCHARFDCQRRLPKMLLCRHTLCQLCVLKGKRGSGHQVACPVCKQTNAIPSDIDSLENDPIVMNLIDDQSEAVIHEFQRTPANAKGRQYIRTLLERYVGKLNHFTIKRRTYFDVANEKLHDSVKQTEAEINKAIANCSDCLSKRQQQLVYQAQSKKDFCELNKGKSESDLQDAIKWQTTLEDMLKGRDLDFNDCMAFQRNQSMIDAILASDGKDISPVTIGFTFTLDDMMRVIHRFGDITCSFDDRQADAQNVTTQTQQNVTATKQTPPSQPEVEKVAYERQVIYLERCISKLTENLREQDETYKQQLSDREAARDIQLQAYQEEANKQLEQCKEDAEKRIQLERESAENKFKKQQEETLKLVTQIQTSFKAKLKENQDIHDNDKKQLQKYHEEQISELGETHLKELQDQAEQFHAAESELQSHMQLQEEQFRLEMEEQAQEFQEKESDLLCQMDEREAEFTSLMEEQEQEFIQRESSLKYELDVKTEKYEKDIEACKRLDDKRVLGHSAFESKVKLAMKRQEDEHNRYVQEHEKQSNKQTINWKNRFSAQEEVHRLDLQQQAVKFHQSLKSQAETYERQLKRQDLEFCDRESSWQCQMKDQEASHKLQLQELEDNIHDQRSKIQGKVHLQDNGLHDKQQELRDINNFLWRCLGAAIICIVAVCIPWWTGYNFKPTDATK